MRTHRISSWDGQQMRLRTEGQATAQHRDGLKGNRKFWSLPLRPAASPRHRRAIEVDVDARGVAGSEEGPGTPDWD